MLPWKSCKLKIKLAFKLGDLPVFASVGEYIFVLIWAALIWVWLPCLGARAQEMKQVIRRAEAQKNHSYILPTGPDHKAFPLFSCWRYHKHDWSSKTVNLIDWCLGPRSKLNPSAWGTQHFTLHRHVQPLPLISPSVTDKLRLINEPLNYISVHSCRWILNMSFGQNEHR